MPPATENLPRISVITPTLNAEAILENCLSSIARQTYPRDRIEIILADAHSRDRTRQIAQKYGAIVLDDNGKNMEDGKRLALQHATGDYICFMDADNEVTHPDYFALAIQGLAANPQALGVESYYLPSPKMTSFCRYITSRLHISDPVSWLMTTNPQLAARNGEIERWTLPNNSCSYPLGANGFFYRRQELESVQADDKFQDTHVALFLMKRGQREWLRVRGRGVHHYYIQSFWLFIKKRRRATAHYMRVREEVPANWMQEKPPVPLWLAAAYCLSIFGPLWHTVLGLARDRDPAWLWHFPTCPASVIGHIWGVIAYRRGRNDPRLVATLQVKQELKPDPSKKDGGKK